MSRIAVIAALCIAVSASAYAQQVESSAPAAAPPAPLIVRTLAFPGAERASLVLASGTCRLEDKVRLPPQAWLVVTGVVRCLHQDEGYEVPFFEVLYRGKPFTVHRDGLSVMLEDQEALGALSTEQKAELDKTWRLESLKLARRELDEVQDELDDKATLGIALLESSIYDTSEYTEGTGYRARIYNAGKKAIKYITFSVQGLNPVGDAVRRLGSKGSHVQLRGVGPVAPGDEAAWEDDYMWTTDLVETHRVVRVRIEYMDGTTRTHKDPKKLFLSPKSHMVLRESL